MQQSLGVLPNLLWLAGATIVVHALRALCAETAVLLH